MIQYQKFAMPSSSYNHTTLTTFQTSVRRHYKCTSKLQ